MNVDIASLGIWYLVFLFSTTVHEAAHAWVGNWGGDPTARLGGHVTLDPLVHIRSSPFGMLLVPIISYLSWGWMTGWASVPFDPTWGKRYPRRQAMMSAAGPTANMVLSLSGVALIKLLVPLGVLQYGTVGFASLVAAPPDTAPGSLVAALALALSILVNLNLILAVFNLIPLPPFDGAHVLEGIFPKAVGGLFDSIRSMPVWSLVSMVLAWNLFPSILAPIYGWFLRAMF